METEKNNTALFLIGTGIPVMKVVSTFYDFNLSSSLPFVGLVAYSFFRKSSWDFTHIKAFLLMIYFFAVFALLSCVYSNAPQYGIYKSVFFLVYGFFIVFMACKSIKSEKDVSSLFTGIMVGSCIFVLSMVALYWDSFSITRFTRVSLGDNNPIITAQQLGLGVVMSFWVAVLKKTPLHTCGVMIVSVLSVVFMALSGSKGPIIALIFSLFLWLLISPSTKTVWIVIASALLGGALLLQLGDVIPQEFVQQRFSIDSSNSVDSRLGSYRLAIDAIGHGDIIDNLLGYGTGDFGYFFTGKDERYFPHNLFLEVLYENGLLGAFAYFTALIYPIVFSFKTYAHKRITSTGMAALTSYVYLVVCAQFSGDIMSNWMIVIFAFFVLRCTGKVTTQPYQRSTLH